jgi:hypothetical protein
MGKYTDIWDWKSEEERQKWLQEHPILKQAIPMYSAEAEEKKLRAKELQEQETIQND